ncbi:MAG TPA: type I methionyl aminopeptidase [Cytophagales bacterium]|nr:type I methionyl aminopeptidase [Cytophagales bacterium]
MSIRSNSDFEGMKHASEVVGETLRKMIDHATPGMSTKELDEFGFEILSSYGANPAPNKEYDFPGWTCISVNQEAAHGIPSSTRILKEGDLVNVDVSAEVNGYYGDNGSSFVLGNDLQNLNPLVNASREILLGAISRIKGGVRIADIGGYIEKEAKRKGFTTLRNLVGHGIGLKLHDEPYELPNFNDPYNKQRFVPLQVGGVLLGGQADLLAVHHQGVAVDADLALEAAMHAVIGQHVGQVIGFEQVVDADDLDVGKILHRSAKHHAADATKPVDTHFDSHAFLQQCGERNVWLWKKRMGSSARNHSLNFSL